MSLYAARFKEGLCLTPDEASPKAIVNNTDKAEHLTFPPGKHDITPAGILWPASHYILYSPAPGEGNPVLHMVAADKDAKIGQPEDYQTPTRLQSSVQKLITPEEPVFIAIPESYDEKRYIRVFYMLYNLPSAMVPVLNSFVPEKRISIVKVVQEIIAKQRNGRISEPKLIEELRLLHPIYKIKSDDAFNAVLSEIAKFGHIKKLTHPNPPIYTLSS